jgi:hypothetical protein
LYLTLSLNKFNIHDANMVFKETDDTKRDVVKNFSNTLFIHFEMEI